MHDRVYSMVCVLFMAVVQAMLRSHRIPLIDSVLCFPCCVLPLLYTWKEGGLGGPPRLHHDSPPSIHLLNLLVLSLSSPHPSNPSRLNVSPIIVESPNYFP